MGQDPFRTLSLAAEQVPPFPSSTAWKESGGTWTSKPCSDSEVQSEPAQAAAARRSSHAPDWLSRTAVTRGRQQ